MMKDPRSQISNHRWQKLLIDITSRKICLEPVLRILILIVILESVLFLNLVVFVVSNIDHDRGMVTQSAHVVDCFLLD